jgi:hypothetical protein
MGIKVKKDDCWQFFGIQPKESEGQPCRILKFHPKDQRNEYIQLKNLKYVLINNN